MPYYDIIDEEIIKFVKAKKYNPQFYILYEDEKYKITLKRKKYFYDDNDRFHYFLIFSYV